MFGGFIATNAAAVCPNCWRLAFHAMAAVAFVTTYLVLRWAVDPRPPARSVISPLQLGGGCSRRGSVR